MKSPIDRNGQPLSAYLLKIIAILVRKSGEIRIDAVDMMDDNTDGLIKSYDRDKKQLVLSYLKPGSEVMFIKEAECSSTRSLKSPRSSQVQPLLKSDLMEDSSLSPDHPSRNASTLDDQRLSLLEDQYRKEAAARIVANFPGTPVTEPRREPLRRVRQSFYRD